MSGALVAVPTLAQISAIEHDGRLAMPVGCAVLTVGCTGSGGIRLSCHRS